MVPSENEFAKKEERAGTSKEEFVDMVEDMFPLSIYYRVLLEMIVWGKIQNYFCYFWTKIYVYSLELSQWGNALLCEAVLMSI